MIDFDRSDIFSPDIDVQNDSFIHLKEQFSDYFVETPSYEIVHFLPHRGDQDRTKAILRINGERFFFKQLGSGPFEAFVDLQIFLELQKHGAPVPPYMYACELEKNTVFGVLMPDLSIDEAGNEYYVVASNPEPDQVSVISEPWFRDFVKKIPKETKDTIHKQLLQSLYACTGIPDVQAFAMLRQREYIDLAQEVGDFWPIIANSAVYMFRGQKDDPANSSILITDITKPSAQIARFEKIDRLYGKNLSYVALLYSAIFQEQFQLNFDSLKTLDLPASQVISKSLEDGNATGLEMG